MFWMPRSPIVLGTSPSLGLVHLIKYRLTMPAFQCVVVEGEPDWVQYWIDSNVCLGHAILCAVLLCWCCVVATVVVVVPFPPPDVGCGKVEIEVDSFVGRLVQT